ncbi:Hypothetical predicted protein [Pelobates cultripes]|uniref:Protein phosphatase 1 regulatory subunit 26 N-terminal domain-containing protein n=1 Tax=Pelobates cultripes TaxID=61616 RepID=A0AAD1WPE2_PELCU|nr:Hypothetical predicted protein [Pelobates cultripes]
MFLMNALPLVAFKTTWVPFGQTATCRLPVCFSESEEDNSGTSITAQVQSIINNLQSDESSLDVTGDYECIMQKNRKGEIHIDRGLTSNTSVFKGHARESATLVVPAQFKDNKEENSGCGPLILESDSDDSVDRDIEEAIQEYLKNKGTVDDPSNTENAKKPVTTEKERDLLTVSQKNVPSHTCPDKMETTNEIFDGFKQHDRPRSASPDSVSSDDSFEQSIKQEIEQFLQDKKQQNIANETGAGNKSVQNTTSIKPKSKSSKVSDKPCTKQGSREPAGNPITERVGTQLKSFKVNTDGSKNTCNRTQPKANVSRHNKNLTLQAKESVQSINKELSDSSSDDGIEEAIQLYQLEKSRQENNLKVPLIVTPERVKTKPQLNLNCSPAADKINVPDDSRKTENRKRKMPVVKPTASQDITSYQTVISKKPFSVSDERNPICATGSQATCRAETSAELMCAEAILDISKAILPSQPESNFTANSTSQRESDSDSAVDSDDSIEQEIRTFLARKAEAEGSNTSSVKHELSVTLSKPEHETQPSVSKTKLSLTNKRKMHENKFTQEQMINISEKTTSTSNFHSRTELGKFLHPSDTVENSCMRTGTYVVGRAKPPCPSEPGIASGHHNLDFKNVESFSGFLRSPGKINPEERDNYSGDESSSLDSDEDLDTAIKDLLKSKKKCKKRMKESRSPCKKKVRFGESPCKLANTLDSDQRDDCSAKLSVNKSCFLSSNSTKDHTLRKIKSNLKVKEDKKEKVANSGTNLLTSTVVGNNSEHKLTCASVKTETEAKQCALSQAQDSSSVDSDDSIEQEIRKFLAERARESAELIAAQKGSCISNPGLNEVKGTPTVKQEVPSSAVTEACLEPTANYPSIVTANPQPAVTHRLSDCKQSISPVGQLRHRPADVAMGSSPMPRKDCLRVKQECCAAQDNVITQSDDHLQTPPGRVVIKTEINGSQGKSHLPVSGNFVAGLKYISGNDKQLVLNVGNTGPTKLTSNFYKPGQHIAKQTSCQAMPKKGLLLEKAKVVQASVSPKSPLVRPGLYLLTTQVCKENSALCLPINTSQYETGVNLMSLQYCHGQVATHLSPAAGELCVQQPKSGEIRKQTTHKAGEIPTLDPQAPVTESRPSHANEAALEAGSGRHVEEGKERLSSFFSTRIDPGMTIDPYIMLSAEQICNQFGLRRHCRRNTEKVYNKL